MSLLITQTPTSVSLAQSPLIFTLAENTAVITSSSFQYTADLFIWSGSVGAAPTASNYTLVKFPNLSNVGIFDVSRIVNSTLTDYLQATPSSARYFKINANWQYKSGSVFVTGSNVTSSIYTAIDGYSTFQEAISQPVYEKTPFWPLMTDGPVTQSAFIDNYGTSGIYVGNSAAPLLPTSIKYVGSNGSTGSINVFTTGSSTTQLIVDYPIGPGEANFPLSKIGLEWYTTQAFNGNNAIGALIRYDIVCVQKYPNVRIKWKNKFGQFDYFNFYGSSNQSFGTSQKTYQPTIGSWTSNQLTYQKYETAISNYTVSDTQTLVVNTQFIPQDYNDIIKQMLVSDEIYWVYDEAFDLVKPLSIVNNNLRFKTGVVDKLIQYTFTFDLGQPYKLII
jgi:hypothetical protein